MRLHRLILLIFSLIPDVHAQFAPVALWSVGSLYSFSSHTFTNCGTTGSSGPSLATCRSSYSATTWASNSSFFTMSTNGIQEWKVPATATYRITATGADGGNNGYSGGRGVVIRGDFSLTRGQVLKILVGQKGGDGPSNCDSGSGGGSFVTNSSNSPYIIAGGGSGSSYYIAGTDGNYGTSGGNSCGNGGTSGAGGAGAGASGGSSGGGGLTGSGAVGSYSNAGGTAFTLGGTGGPTAYNALSFGGFGGGAGGHGNCYIGSGGAGGYSGGGAGGYCGNTRGGGGGSYNGGSNATNVGYNGSGHGSVVIQKL